MDHPVLVPPQKHGPSEPDPGEVSRHVVQQDTDVQVLH